MPRSLDGGAVAVRAFIEAFNDEDLDGLVAVLDPRVEIQASRGVVIGHDEARGWATRSPDGHLHQRLVVDELCDEGTHVIVSLHRQWYWREQGEVAEEAALTVVATIRDGLIARWQPYEERADALRAVGRGDDRGGPA